MPANKSNFDHLGYSYVQIDSGVAKRKYRVKDFVLAKRFLLRSNATKKNHFEQISLTIDCEPDLECIICALDVPVPIVPVWPGVAVPFWCGNVWKFIALVGSISSRKPNKWNVAYGQISSSMPV